jgi:hypothetical protein
MFTTYGVPKLELSNLRIRFVLFRLREWKGLIEVLFKMKGRERINKFRSEGIRREDAVALSSNKAKCKSIKSTEFIKENTFTFDPTPFRGNVTKKAFEEKEISRLLKTQELSDMRKV